jgi:hypothetical protein
LHRLRREFLPQILLFGQLWRLSLLLYHEGHLIIGGLLLFSLSIRTKVLWLWAFFFRNTLFL